MRRLLFAILACLSSWPAQAQKQPSGEITGFKNYTTSIEYQRQAAFRNKNYPSAEKIIKEWINKYNSLTPEQQKNFSNKLPSIYYNLACCINLQGRGDEALSYLEKSVKFGFAEYALAKTDADLESLHNTKRFKAALQTIRGRGDLNYILQVSGPYNHKIDKNLPVFTYQSANDPALVTLKNKFNLDSVSGNGDEISRLKNLLLWAHNAAPHNGSEAGPDSKNAADIIAFCKKEKHGVNCRMMATILRDVYQAEGFPARVVSCMPKDSLDSDCHVINVVWSKTLNKWIWMDPSFNAYVTDAKGNLLSIEEVRERLVKGSDDLVLNSDANHNNEEKQSKEGYLGHYMSKNLYWLQCATDSEWGMETDKVDKFARTYVNLYPGSFTTKHVSNAVKNAKVIVTHNPDYFWQKPAGM
ncbi:transglutaminase-like domain-containing protein [Mucilaginibacter sp. UR6-11]|uniref:transglutaminase-like domain-containing protein n=1 Tax=Mucilaginibacter sp. UR6-11 TaxID=1435644 RepID=UPI001E333954|nr:transglutaminase-like domain-containing protein [Mucilaginibacter sp. UR6-11]MCC8426982.1 transglutaminase-like domain-containing protein [Mucilaginibacter sp. UR6-11]